MQTGEAEFLLRFLLPQLESEQAITTKLLLAIPPEKEAFRPNDRAMTVLGLARHIALTEMWFLDAVIWGEFVENEELPSGLETCSDVVEWYARNVAERAPVLAALSGEELLRPLDFLGLRNDPAVAYLNIVIRHSVHHRGQLSTYLRCLNADVPAIYVESADEPWGSSPGSDPESKAAPPAF